MSTNKFSSEWDLDSLCDIDDDISAEKKALILEKITAWFESEETQGIYEKPIRLKLKKEFPEVIKGLMKWCYISGYIDGTSRSLERQHGKEKNGSDSGSGPRGDLLEGSSAVRSKE